MKKLIVVLAAMLTFTSTAFAQLGSLASDLVFTPVTPCRIMDTRNAGAISGILLAGSTRTFFGTSAVNNYPSQGGSSPNCNIPLISDVSALVLNFTVVSPATAGFITAFPADATLPTAATVNFTAGAVVGNNATLKLRNVSGGMFNIFTTSNVHVVGDVVGYYAKPVAAGSLECIVVAPRETFSVPANFTGFHFTTATCSAGYVAMSPYCWNSDNPNLLSTGGGIGSAAGAGAWCGWRNATAAAINASQSTNCCRIPGR